MYRPSDNFDPDQFFLALDELANDDWELAVESLWDQFTAPRLLRHETLKKLKAELDAFVADQSRLESIRLVLLDLHWSMDDADLNGSDG